MQYTRILVVLLAVAALTTPVASSAFAATSAPNAHDRTLIARLDHKVSTFRAIAAKKNDDASLNSSLKKCAALNKDPAQAFAALFALIPVLLADLVNEYRPQLTDVRNMLAAMHPDAPLFRRWVTAERQSFDLILRFDNHGKKVDYCAAAMVLLDKRSTARDVQHTLGIDPALIATLFASGPSTSSATLKRLNPKMRSFLRAAGVTAKHATALTT